MCSFSKIKYKEVNRIEELIENKDTEILTEFSDITVLSNYTYEDVAVGYAAQTGPTPSDPTIRTLQAKLDDIADVRDFGAKGDGAADGTWSR